MALRTDRSIEAGFSQISQTRNSVIPEEGSFTPSLITYNPSAPTIAIEFDFEVTIGRYQKIGNRCIVDISFYGDNVTQVGTGYLAFSNLPFLADDTFEQVGTIFQPYGNDADGIIIPEGEGGSYLALQGSGAPVLASLYGGGDNVNFKVHFEYWLA